MHVDARIASLARRPGSLLTRDELLDAGIGRGAIAHRLRTGAMRREHRGVYTLVPHPLEPDGRALAAVLACGDGAALADGWSAWLWGIEAGPVGTPQVVRSGANREGPAEIRLRRSAWLPADHVTVRRGVPVTTPARTLLDLAAAGPAARLEPALDEALAQRLVTPADMLALTGTGRPGSVTVRAALRGSTGFSRGEAERRFMALVRRAELPRPLLNARIAGFEVDAHWPDARLAVEIDGFAVHGSRAAFERDRERDQVLLTTGLRVVRVSWRQLTQRPEALSARLGALLARTA